MKVIISQPMKGKAEEQIRAEREETVRRLEAKGYEVVDTVFPDFTNQGSIPLKYLAKSIEFIADADFVYFMPGWENARGCRIEYQCCVDYGIPFEVSEDKISEFKGLCTPVNAWLQKNHHPMAKIMIETNRAEIVEGVLGVPFEVKD